MPNLPFYYPHCPTSLSSVDFNADTQVGTTPLPTTTREQHCCAKFTPDQTGSPGKH